VTDVRRFLRFLVTGLTLVLPVAVPNASADDRAERAKDWRSSRAPKPLKARDVAFPPYEVRTLANGLRVIVVSHHEQPAVSVRLIVRAGAAQDPRGKAGLATLAASLLDQGTATRSAADIADTIDYVGGALGTGSGTDLSFVNVLVLKDSFELAMDLAADIVRNPAFEAAEIERQRQQMLSALQVNHQDPEYLAGVVIDRLVYGFHPYGVPSAGTPESVAGLSREDLVAFHGTWFAPNNALLAIVGDLTAEEAFKGAERAFGAWRRAEVPAAVFGEPPDPTRRVVLIDRPGAVQTEIRVGNLAIPRKHRDYDALDLAVKILGGEGANRLQRVLRSERQLTYGASADIQSLKQSGAIVAETDTRSEATGEALRIVVEEFWRLQRDLVDEVELRDAKAYLTGHFPLTIETPDAIALQVLNVLFYELDVKDLQTQRERVERVSADDVQRVSRVYLRPSRLAIVLVGDASQVAPQLKGAGFPEFELIGMDELDLTSATLRRPRTPVAPALP
jgi:zinc protease